MSKCLPDLAFMTDDLHIPDTYSVLISVASHKLFRQEEKKKNRNLSLLAPVLYDSFTEATLGIFSKRRS